MVDGTGGRFSDWLAGLGRRELVVVAAVGLLVVGGAVLWYVRSLPQPVRVQALRAPPTPSPSPVPLIVHVAGAVRQPGVYELPQGSRVLDAIEAAGGARNGANLEALNLAALLLDAQQVLVPTRAPPTGAPESADHPGPVGAGGKVNLNTATTEELDTLPGIGEVLAGRIVAYREDHGPFTSVDQLMEVSGIGEARMAELRDLVTV